MASIAPGANATTMSLKFDRRRQRDHDDEDRGYGDGNREGSQRRIDVAEQGFGPHPRKARADQCADPDQRDPRSQSGSPPSTSPVPCSTLAPIIAPNIQLAGNFISRNSSEDGHRSCDQRGQLKRRGGRGHHAQR